MRTLKILICLLALSEFSFAQNQLLIQDLVSNNDCLVHAGKKIKIKTLDNQTIKGKLLQVKDSSIIIGKSSEMEIPIKDIYLLYYNQRTAWKTGGGIALGVYSAVMTEFVAIGINEAIKQKKNPPTGKVIDNPLPGFAVVGAIGLPPLYYGTYAGLLKKKKYKVQARYRLLIVK